MKQFNFLNNIFGWVFFLIALVTYALTAEQTTSWWDCGERILAAYKLQVMHPPGAPFFVIVGRLFTMLAPNPDMVAFFMNMLSALSGAFAVLFIFWITTHFARKLIMQNEHVYTTENLWLIIGAGGIAALSCTFLDTLWFIAVESEVYAFSTFFTTLVFWSMVRWYNHEDRVYADRWLLFIAFMIGLSIGVHLMSILVVPAIAMMYYIKYYDTDLKGILIAFVIGAFVLAFIFTGIVSNYLTIVAPFELLTVNSWGWFIGSGLVLVTVPLIGLFLYGVYHGAKIKNRELQVASLCLLLIFTGFSSYLATAARANANPPINMNKPGDVFSMHSYLNREQYGDRPLMYGPHFASFPIDMEEGSKRWFKVGDRYEHIGNRISYVFPDEDKTFFPRLGHWQEDRHDRAYRHWLQLRQNETPSAGDNYRYFFNYQLGYMYFRYFMWNFSGRQNDIQGTYQNNNGNWITGFDFIDNRKIGPLDKYPDYLRDNKGYSKFYGIPFILGLIGIFVQYRENRKYFYVVMGMFLFTGAISIIYFNQPPVEPRERDYSTVASFITYTIWLGLGVIGLYQLVKKYLPKKVIAAQLAVLLALPAPLLMGINGWDNHDRSNRSVVKDFATNYLESLAPNAVIFTQGDNDTYPLWNVQEVNGVRPDVRIINLSLLGVDWYINQLHYYVNEAPPLQLSFEREQYLSNRRDVVRFMENPALGLDMDRHYNLKEIMQFIASDERRTKAPDRRGGDPTDYLPVRRVFIPVDKNEIIDLNIVPENVHDEIVDQIRWELPKNTLMKNDLMTLDIIANNLWERPIYFAVTVSPDTYQGLENFFQLEGMAYRLVPVRTPGGQQQSGRIATDIMYDNVVNKFKFGNAGAPGVYLDETTLRMVMNMRSNLGRLAAELVQNGENEKAIEILDLAMENFPKENAPYNLFMMSYPEVYYSAGAKEKARTLVRELANMYEQEFDYNYAVHRDRPGQDFSAQNNYERAAAVINQLVRVTSRFDEELNEEMEAIFDYIEPRMRQ